MNSTVITSVGDFNKTIVGVTTTMNTTQRPVQPTVFIPWDNPDMIITKKTADDLVFCMECVIFPVLTLFGCTGNIMSLVILIQKKLRNSTGVILIGLVVSDLGFLVTNMIRKSSCIIDRFDSVLEEKYTATIFGPNFYVTTSFSRVSAWLVVLISIERCVAVAFPLKIKGWISKTKMIVSVVFIYIMTFIIVSPIAAQYKLGTFYNPRTTVTTYYIATSEFYETYKDLLKIHNEIFGVILLRYMPVILVILLNLTIIILLQRRRKWSKDKMSKTCSKGQAKITKMLLIVCGVCLLCTMPGSLLILVSEVVDGFAFFKKYHNMFVVMSNVSTLLSMINSSVNFIIFMVFNKQFAKTYKKIFCNLRLLARIQRQSTTDKSETSESKKTDWTSKILSKDASSNSDDADHSVDTSFKRKQASTETQPNTEKDVEEEFEKPNDVAAD